jgi:Uma2 family endonuclease/predicted DNA-binding transcriptional regulator AlpA
MEEAQMLTARELAQLLQVSVETIWRYTRTAQIPYVELGKRRYRYDPEKVLQALGLCVKGPPACRVREREASCATDKVYTYQDYLHLPEKEGYSYEVLDGTLVCEPAPIVQHQRVSRRLQRLLEDYFFVADPGGEVLNAPLDVTLSDTNVVQPDLMYISELRSGIIEEQRINGAPNLVVEILSPTTRGKDRIRKRMIYERLGVPHYWIVDPEARAIEAYAIQGNAYVLRAGACEEEIFAHPDFPGLSVELAQLWKQRGR